MGNTVRLISADVAYRGLSKGLALLIALSKFVVADFAMRYHICGNMV